jgi:avermitilol synthase
MGSRDAPAPGAGLFDAPLWGDLGCRIARNPRTEAARERNFSWLREHNLFGSERAFSWYQSWDLEGLTGAVYPYVDDAGLDLCNKATTFMTVFDDQFEGEPGDISARACATVRTYLEIIDGSPGASLISPLGSLFAEIWRDWRAAGLSPEWHARVRNDWVYCLTTMAHERAALKSGTLLALDEYLQLRHGSSYMPLFLDLIEAASGVECPRIIFHSPHIQIMRDITIDLVNFMNDVLSLHKEMSRGDNDNVVLTMQREHGCSLDRAIAITCETIKAKARRFMGLREGLPGLCSSLGLSARETESALHHGRALEFWIGGYDPWQRRSSRYKNAFAERPPHEAWAFEMGHVKAIS